MGTDVAVGTTVIGEPVFVAGAAFRPRPVRHGHLLVSPLELSHVLFGKNSQRRPGSSAPLPP